MALIAFAGCAPAPVPPPASRAARSPVGATEAPDPAFDALVAHVDERLAVGNDVARAKWIAHKPIEDAAREEQLLDAVRAKAAARGLDIALAVRFFRAQIESSKDVQRAAFQRWESGAAPPPREAPDLATELRPRLDALTDALLADLAQLAARSPRGREALDRAITRHAPSTDVPPEARARAFAPLRE